MLLLISLNLLFFLNKVYFVMHRWPDLKIVDKIWFCFDYICRNVALIMFRVDMPCLKYKQFLSIAKNILPYSISIDFDDFWRPSQRPSKTLSQKVCLFVCKNSWNWLLSIGKRIIKSPLILEMKGCVCAILYRLFFGLF